MSTALARLGERSKSSVLQLLSKLGNKNGGGGIPDEAAAANDSSSFLIKEWKRRFESRVPGVMGIRNHGNTCFINAVLQCLSYTEALAEYLVLDNYKYDLKRKNKKKKFSKRRKNVGDGEITEQLATVLKSLWSLEYTPEISVKFKALIEKYGGPQYKGNAQQDAQEFLLWLLDRVHEDLNCSSNKLKRKNAPTFISEEEFLAHEALYNYARCNSSFVMDVFQAQFRSSLTCRTCDRVSNTFDPFLCVSLPIPPTKKYVPLFVYVLYLDQTPRHVKIGFVVNENETMKGLKEILSKDTGIDEETLFLTELKDTMFSPYLKCSASISELNPDADLYCIETPCSPKLSDDESEFLILSWINVLKINDKVEKRFGTPYAIQVSRETLYCDLQKLLLKEVSPILHSDVLVGEQNIPIFKIKVLIDEETETSYLSPDTELPLYTDIIEKAIKLGSVVKLVLEWDALAKSQIINDDSSSVEIHSSVAATQDESYPKEASSVSLQECFSLYTSEERLGQGDAWFCPECNRKREVVKKMGLWSVPDVLVIHLKRFRQCTLSTDKLLTLIDFPLDGFDMSPNVSRSSTSSSSSTIHHHQQQQHQAVESSINKVIANAFNPWRNPKRYLVRSNVITQEENYIYDLYAVCNHHGADLQGGHYTATCRNPTDGVWYNFDDVRTKSLSENEVVTKDAYILFYQRRTSSSSSSAASSSTSSSGTEHWVYRMPDFNFCKNKSSTLKPTSSTNNFVRNSEKYATLPAKKTSEVSFSKKTILDAEAAPTLAIPEEDEDDVSRPLDKNDVD